MVLWLYFNRHQIKKKLKKTTPTKTNEIHANWIKLCYIAICSHIYKFEQLNSQTYFTKIINRYLKLHIKASCLIAGIKRNGKSFLVVATQLKAPGTGSSPVFSLPPELARAARAWPKSQIQNNRDKIIDKSTKTLQKTSAVTFEIQIFVFQFKIQSFYCVFHF